MILKNDIELSNTHKKLRELQESYQARLYETPADPHVHEFTLQSRKRLINQLQEEIVRYAAHQPVPPQSLSLGEFP